MSLPTSIRNQDWYQDLVDECNTIKTEGLHSSRWLLIETYHGIGLQILQNLENMQSGYGSEYMKVLSKDIGVSTRNLYYSLKLVVREFSIYEKHETLTKMNVSVAFKLTIARFLNSSIILVIVNTEPKNWFKGGNLAYDAIILILLMAV